jgi:hypothetical protein
LKSAGRTATFHSAACRAMWELSNRTPYAAERTWVQDKDGAKHWVVVVKATFDIGPGGALKPAAEQVPALHLPEYLGEDGKSSLVYEADMIASKPGTDVYVNGHAIAAGGKPTRRMSVGLRVHGRQKVLEVTGDRVYERDITGGVVPSAPMPFLKVPIVYERAYGGYDADDPDPAQQKMFAPNPVGTGVTTSRGKLLGKPVANVEFPGADPAKKGAAGFGALCSYWEPRIGFGGTYDGKWITSRKPLLPEDFDPRFFMCAPADQQFVPHLRGGERIEVAGMTPSGALGFDIPRVALGFETHIDGKKKHHKGALQTVIVEPDHPRVILVWQTQILCHREMDFLDRTLIREKEYIQ